MTDDMLARYQKAASLHSTKLLPLMRNRAIEPRWSSDSSSFWYRRELPVTGHEFVRFDIAAGTRTPLFDHEILASTLSEHLDADVPATALPIADVSEAPDGGTTVSLTTGQTLVISAAGEVTMPSRRAPALTSPDGSTELFTRDHDIWLREVASGDERALTTTGEAHFAWGGMVENNMVNIPFKRRGLSFPPVATQFSRTGRFVFTLRADERAVGAMPFLETVPADQARPRLHLIRNVLEDEDHGAEPEVRIFDTVTGTSVLLELGDDAVSAFMSNGDIALTWSADDAKCYLLRHNTGRPTARLSEIDPVTGEHRELITETAEGIYELNTYIYSLPLTRVLPDTGEAIWFSQREGWGRLYRYDLASGACFYPLTSGEYVVSDIVHLDPVTRTMIVVAHTGLEGRNPYQRVLLRVDLDGGGQQLLTPEFLDHVVPVPTPNFFSLIFGRKTPISAVSPDGRYIVDHMSSVSTPPEIVLRDAGYGGRIIASLERTDVSALLDAGFVPPIIVSGKATDGVTDLWGALSLPAEATKETPVPVVDLMYAGFQITEQPTAWIGGDGSNRCFPMPQFAALGIATISLDGRGTPGRDRVFRQWTQGCPQEPRGLEDHVALITQVAQSHPIDVTRVGVTGHSYGGYNSVRSILSFPEFFTACVSSAGVHVPEKMPKGAWSWHVGADTKRDDPSYLALSNLPLASRLTGKLLLLHGELDENATPDHAYALMKALIAAGKRFDVKIWPDTNHYQSNSYRELVTWDHFVTHLLGKPLPDFTPDPSVRTDGSGLS